MWRLQHFDEFTPYFMCIIFCLYFYFEPKLLDATQWNKIIFTMQGVNNQVYFIQVSISFLKYWSSPVTLKSNNTCWNTRNVSICVAIACVAIKLIMSCKLCKCVRVKKFLVSTFFYKPNLHVEKDFVRILLNVICQVFTIWL